MKRYKSERGAGAVELVLILLVVAIVGFVGWFVWQSQQSVDKTYTDAAKTTATASKSAVTSFTACKSATGSMMLETYPEQCVTKDGKKFTDPGQTIRYLDIKEWGVKLDVSDVALADAVYVKTSSTPDGVERMVLATKDTLSMGYTCGGQTGDASEPVTHMQNNDQDYLLRSKTTDALVANSQQPVTAFVKIGDYYYVYAHNTGHGNCAITDAVIAKKAEAAANAYTKSTIVAE